MQVLRRAHGSLLFTVRVLAVHTLTEQSIAVVLPLILQQQGSMKSGCPADHWPR